MRPRRRARAGEGVSGGRERIRCVLSNLTEGSYPSASRAPPAHFPAGHCRFQFCIERIQSHRRLFLQLSASEPAFHQTSNSNIIIWFRARGAKVRKFAPFVKVNSPNSAPPDMARDSGRSRPAARAQDAPRRSGRRRPRSTLGGAGAQRDSNRVSRFFKGLQPGKVSPRFAAANSPSSFGPPWVVALARSRRLVLPAATKRNLRGRRPHPTTAPEMLGRRSQIRNRDFSKILSSERARAG